MEQRKHTLLIFILGLLSAIGPFSIDMYLPGFPAIALDLKTTADAVAYSLSSFFIGVCLGQLICGPLLDRFGRKIPLITGLTIYAIASIGCSFSTSIEALIIFRFLQALGGCVGMVAPNAIVRDVFPVEQTARIYSLLILILGVSPILAPTVGSYVVASFGWQAVFMVLTVASILLLLTVLKWLPESRKADTSISLKPASIARAYLVVLRTPQFTTYALAGAVASASIFAYLAGSPSVFMDLHEVSEKQYGLIFGFIATGLIACSQINRKLLSFYTSDQILKVVLLSQTVIGLILLTGLITSFVGLYSTIGLMFLFISLQGFTFPNSAAMAMAPFNHGVGSASAMLGAMQMILGATASAFAGALYNGTAIPLATIMTSCTAFGLIILLMGARKKRHLSNRDVADEEAMNMIEKF